MNLPADLIGDGRKAITPRHSEYRIPIKLKSISLSNCKMIIYHFLDKGLSIHQLPSTTGWVIEEYCILNDIALLVEHPKEDSDIKFAIYQKEETD